MKERNRERPDADKSKGGPIVNGEKKPGSISMSALDITEEDVQALGVGEGDKAIAASFRCLPSLAYYNVGCMVIHRRWSYANSYRTYGRRADS